MRHRLSRAVLLPPPCYYCSAFYFHTRPLHPDLCSASCSAPHSPGPRRRFAPRPPHPRVPPPRSPVPLPHSHAPLPPSPPPSPSPCPPSRAEAASSEHHHHHHHHPDHPHHPHHPHRQHRHHCPPPFPAFPRYDEYPASTDTRGAARRARPPPRTEGCSARTGRRRGSSMRIGCWRRGA